MTRPAEQARSSSRRGINRQLRRRAYELAQASYADYLATLTEIYEARGLEEALSFHLRETGDASAARDDA